MRSSGATAVLRGTLRRASAEWVWGALGMGAATASTTFAAYMLAFGPTQPSPRGTPDFGVFAHLRPRTHAALAGEIPPAHRSAILARGGGAEEPTPDPDPRAGVDFDPTGSISPVTARDERTMPPIFEAAVPQTSAPLSAFILRDVFDGKAVVEARGALSLVTPGSLLDGAGEVLSIEHRGRRWVVTTTRGTIISRLR